MIPVRDDWGRYGSEPPCEHLVALRAFLEASGLKVWAEHSEGPWGWCNVHCPHCHRTYETTLQPTEAEDGVLAWTNEEVDDE